MRSSAASNATSHERSTESSSPRPPWESARNQPEAPLDIHRGINAAAERFFAVLKSEIGTTAWPTRMQARQDVFWWIAQYYNRERIHSTIGYLTPHQARTRYRQRLDLAA
ncbi:integrase core domain-containing protein [Streptomyces hokutonensis]|uniref:integrase core domain-containing protein n=1 Tax=Streptomyces hokutonensis TaxID=1306990 RepID=UPI000A309956